LRYVDLGTSVETIGNNAFASNEIKNIILPSSLNEIGLSAFSQNLITDISIPSSITFIGASTFAYNKLTTVDIPNSVIHIGNNAFTDNELTSVTLPNKLDSLNNDVFENNNLSSINIPESITYIGDRTFKGNNLIDIIVPVNVIFVGKEAYSLNDDQTICFSEAIKEGYHFRGWNGSKGSMCTSLLGQSYTADFSYILIDSDVVIENNEIISMNIIDETEVFIPETIDNQTVEKIGFGAFFNKSLDHVMLPSTVIEIKEASFNLNNINEIIIPESVIFIGKNAFSDNTLTSFVLPISIRDNAIFKSWNGSIPGDTEVSNLIISYTAIFSENQIITFDEIGVEVYGNPELILSATASSALAVTFSSSDETIAKVIDDKLQIISAGTCFIYADQEGNTEYNPAPQVFQELVINKKNIIVSVDANQTKVYGDAEPTLTYTSDALIGGDAFSGELNRESGENVGFYEIYIGSLSAGNNYNITFHSEDFEITETLSDNNIDTNILYMYPNPTKSDLFITNDTKNKLNIKVIDINGRVIIEKSSSNDKIRLNLEGQPSGAYNVLIENDGNYVVKKIIKK